MVGLHSGTHSQLAVIGGILTIAIADAFSDALGMHISQESENQHTSKEIWQSTATTFLLKFSVAISFIAPVLLLELTTAMIASIIYGLLLIGILSAYIAMQEKKKPWRAIAEHLLIAITVITVTHFAGDWISATFG